MDANEARSILRLLETDTLYLWGRMAGLSIFPPGEICGRIADEIISAFPVPPEEALCRRRLLLTLVRGLGDLAERVRELEGLPAANLPWVPVGPKEETEEAEEEEWRDASGEKAFYRSVVSPAEYRARIAVLEEENRQLRSAIGTELSRLWGCESPAVVVGVARRLERALRGAAADLRAQPFDW